MHKPSTIERLHQSEAERAKPTIRNGQLERERRWEAEEPQRLVDAAAKALPDDLFNDHPGLALATATAEAAKARAEGLSRHSDKRAIGETLQALETALHGASAAVRDAALDDAMAGDNDFPKALAAMESLDRIKRQVEAARIAKAVIERLPNGLAEFSDMAHARKEARYALLIQLKRDHLQANPDLLEAR